MQERARVPQEPVRAIVPRRALREEVLVVLSLSLLASAVYAVINLLSAPVHGVAVSTYPQVQLATQLASIFFFGLAPVWLVWHLVKRSGEGVQAIGLSTDRPAFDVWSGAGLAAIVGAAGIGVYLAAVALDVNRIVVPIPPTGHWWTIPILILGAAQSGLLEEVVVVGYLITRLRQLGAAPWVAVIGSALLRGTYHLYQGWGGFAGNLAMGLFFGAIFLRWRRTWPLVVAHFLVDVGSGVGYLLFKSHLPSL
jgi:membrane protease YdiL (CAAX protease family)